MLFRTFCWTKFIPEISQFQLKTVSLVLVSAYKCCPCADVLIVVVERILLQWQPPQPGLLQQPVGLVDGEVNPPVLGPDKAVNEPSRGFTVPREGP